MWELTLTECLDLGIEIRNASVKDLMNWFGLTENTVEDLIREFKELERYQITFLDITPNRYTIVKMDR